MQDEIYSIYHMTIDPSQFSAFRSLIADIVEATKEEHDTLTYEYVVNADHTQVHTVERYRAAGLLPHQKTFAHFAEKFLSFATIDKLYVYGETTPEMRAKLDGFGALYFTSFEGISR